MQVATSVSGLTLLVFQVLSTLLVFKDLMY
jgi:hypothetical protein